MVSFDKTGIDPENIKDIKTARKGIVLLYNLVEEVSSDNTLLREENQNLRDEISLLKGEQGKPDVKGKNKKSEDISSEKERKETGKARSPKGSKNQKLKLKITRTQVLPVNKQDLPEDAVFKGYETVIVQDIVISSEVIEFKKEVYYSSSLNKNITGILPRGYESSFGPHIQSLIILLKIAGDMTENKIAEFMKSFNIVISPSSINRILTTKKEPFHKEKTDIFLSGLRSSTYQHMDDTSNRINGENFYSHVICNLYYSAYFTRKRKDRLTLLEILLNNGILSYVFNSETQTLLKMLHVSDAVLERLKDIPRDKLFTKEQAESILNTLSLKDLQKKHTLEAMAITFYHIQTQIPIVEILIVDDAPQFKLLTALLALCWIHDGRHYKRLRPVVVHNQNILKNFLAKYWEFYSQLLSYRKDPSTHIAEELDREFDILFSTKTNYNELDERIAKTKAKKEELLLVLKHPEVSLHNNPAELGARALVRKRDISLQSKSIEGAEVQDSFLTIVETAKKLNVNIHDYIFDRISQAYSLPSLADLILERSGYQKPLPVYSRVVYPEI